MHILRRLVAAVRNAMALLGCPEQEHFWISDRMSDRWRLRCLECGGTTAGFAVAPGNLDRTRPAVIEREPISKREQVWQARKFQSQLARRARTRMAS